MDKAERIARVVDQATSRLKPDPELCLDVQAELKSHIEETIDSCRAEGMSDDESLERALEVFGSAEEVGEKLLEANMYRMKLRALARIGLRFVIVPAAIIVGVVICLHLIQRWETFGKSYSVHAFETRHMSEAEKFLWEGDTTRPYGSSRQRAIWEASPENKVYFANYITSLQGGYSHAKGVTLDFLEQELRLGEDVDPDNSVYNYSLGMLYLIRARTWEFNEPDNTRPTFVIRDDTFLQKAVDEFSRARSKPYYKTYYSEMTNERFAAIGEPQKYEHLVNMVLARWGGCFRTMVLDSEAFELLPSFAEYLMDRGRIEEAEILVHSWKDMTDKMVAGAEDSGDLINAYVMARKTLDAYSKYYNQIGDSAKRHKMDNCKKLLRETMHEYQGDNKWSKAFTTGSVIMPSLFNGSFPFLSTEKSDYEEINRAGRLRDYILAERMFLGILSSVLIVILIEACLVSFWQNIRNRQKGNTPLLLIPRFHEMSRVLLVGIIAPIAVYFVVTRVTAIGGRENAITYRPMQSLLEFSLVSVAILYLTLGSSARTLHKRCKRLGISSPPKAIGNRYHRFAAIFLLVIVFLWIFVPEPLEYHKMPGLYYGSHLDIKSGTWFFAASLLIGSLIVVGQTLLVVRVLSAKKSYGQYYGTLARSLMPVFALLLLVFTLVLQPALAAREDYLFKNDPVLRTVPGQPGRLEWESKATAELKAELEKVLNDIDVVMRKEI